MRIAVATPSRGLVGSRTIEAVLRELAGTESVGWFLTHDLPIPDCAERAAEMALTAGADAVWFVEEDVVPPVGALAASLRLLADGYAVAAVDYPVRQGTGCIARATDGSIAWVGLGATLISRSAFEALDGPWFRTERGYGGHDILFCRRVLEAGMRIGQVPDMIAQHVRLEALGSPGTNAGCHKMTILDRIDRPYSEGQPISPVGSRRAVPEGTVILVPRRADGGERDRLWTFCRAWWERTFDARIVEGSHEEGPFCRSVALNRAAAAAGEWTVALIVDADTIPDPNLVTQALRRAVETGQMVLPYDDRRELTPAETEAVLHGATPTPTMGRDFGPAVSGAVVVSRRLWDAVGGFSEEFVGWGAEDNDFADACERTGGKLIRIPGALWHLHHARAADATEGSPILQANRRRWQERRRTWRDLPSAYRSRTRPEGDGHAGERIPAILHRVVIGAEPEQSARWWAGFRALHPAWELRTHRLPFALRDWPLSAWVLPHTVHPAQLSDFIRLEALWREGGVYVDWDMEPYRPFDPLLPLEGFVGWALPHLAANGVMGFRPRHPAVARAIELASERFMADRENLIMVGPGAITDACRDRTDVLMLPPETFYSAGHVANTEQQEGQFAPRPWVYAAHWGFGSWKTEHPWRPEHERAIRPQDERSARAAATRQARRAELERRRQERIAAIQASRAARQAQLRARRGSTEVVGQFE